MLLITLILQVPKIVLDPNKYREVLFLGFCCSFMMKSFSSESSKLGSLVQMENGTCFC